MLVSCRSASMVALYQLKPESEVLRSTRLKKHQRVGTANARYKGVVRPKLVGLVDNTVVILSWIVGAEAAVDVLRNVRVRLSMRVAPRHRVPSPTLPPLGMAMPVVFRRLQRVVD